MPDVNLQGCLSASNLKASPPIIALQETFGSTAEHEAKIAVPGKSQGTILLPPPSLVALAKWHHLMFLLPILKDSNKTQDPVSVVQTGPTQHSVEEKH